VGDERLSCGSESIEFKSFKLEVCIVAVYRGAVGEPIDKTAKNRRVLKVHADVMPRASVSFPPEVYRSLEDLAAKKKVSIAWIVREAVEKYLVDQFPLFGASLLKEDR
jgi:hypothetical protein